MMKKILVILAISAVGLAFISIGFQLKHLTAKELKWWELSLCGIAMVLGVFGVLVMACVAWRLWSGGSWPFKIGDE
jgi:hypothetical protein